SYQGISVSIIQCPSQVASIPAICRRWAVPAKEVGKSQKRRDASSYSLSASAFFPPMPLTCPRHCLHIHVIHVHETTADAAAFAGLLPGAQRPISVKKGVTDGRRVGAIRRE